ncbi:hypothetical protein [Paenibacillus medicaginis]|uniref:Uncharacterized protein n=1 Tax=Paenibacillus medicaginis TaxID=1470560 RepID=A0ABV5C182_9BACL
MTQWSDSPRLSGPPDTQDVGQMLLYVKDLANTVAKMAKDLEFIINGNLDANNIRANSIETKNLQAGSITADKIQAGAISSDKIQAGAITAEKIQANAVTASKIDVDELSAISANLGWITAGIIESIEIYGSLIATRRTGFPRIQLDDNGLAAYSERGGEAVSLGQGGNGGHLVFSDDGSPVGDIFGDGNGLQIGNMGGVYIGSRDDYTYLTKAVSFEQATEIQGLEIKHIKNLKDKLDDIVYDISRIRGELLEDMIINATFDDKTRNLKLYSQGRTVATVNIPK